MSSNTTCYQTVARLIGNLTILMQDFLNITPLMIGRLLRANYRHNNLTSFKEKEIIDSAVHIYCASIEAMWPDKRPFQPVPYKILWQVRNGFYSELERFIRISPVVVGNTVTCQFGSPGDDTMEYREYVEVEVLRIDETIYIVHDKENKIVGTATNPWLLIGCDNAGTLYCNNAAGYGKDSTGIFKECETIQDVLNHSMLFEYYN